MPNPTFIEPPHHVPDEPTDSFVQPEIYSPDNVIGDTIDEVYTEFLGFPIHVPADAYNIAPAPSVHIPAPAIDLVGPKENFVPDHVIGDTLDEIQPAPAISLPSPPLAVGPSTPAPLGHVPAEPFDVPVQTSSSPTAPFDVNIQATSEPQLPRDPNISVTEHVPAPLDYSKIVAKLAYSDTVLSNMLSKIGLDPYSIITGQGAGAADPQLYSKWLLNLGKQIGTAGMARFIATQTALHAMNAENAKIFNPAYFAMRAPGFNGIVPVAIIEATHQELTDVKDKIRTPLVQEALFSLHETPGSRTPVADIAQFNANYSENKYEDSAMFTVGGLVDAALLDTKTSDGVSAQQILDNDASTGRFRIQKNAFFEENRLRIGMQAPKTQFAARSQGRPSPTRGSSAMLARSAFVDGVIPAGFKEDGIDGLVRTRGDAAPSAVIDDDVAYVPVSFTDMRAQGDEYRTVYFRPIITSLSEEYAPNWDQGSYFGRVDPVMKYQNTIRTVNVGFELHAFSPEDLDVIYKKLNWLTSMVYPEVDADMLYKSGPVSRMRIGDVIAVGGRGVPGVITSLGFDYTDSIWELKKNKKLPRSVPVSLSFTVLHEGPVAVFAGKFGTLKLSSKEQTSESDSLLERTRKAATGQEVIVTNIRGMKDDSDV